MHGGYLTPLKQGTATMPLLPKSVHLRLDISVFSEKKRSCADAPTRYMTGLELSELYFEEYGRKIIENHPELSKKIAVGLCGGGSECMGFDDEASRDHDWGPSFCIFCDDDMSDGEIFTLEKEYAKLPGDFLGYALKKSSKGGSDRRGVMRIRDFFSRYIGIDSVPKSLLDWLYIPDECFAEAINGRVFYDGSGTFTDIRTKIKNSRPEDVRIKKICARAAEMAQFGQYNFLRCYEHGERGAALLALSSFVTSAVKMIFLLNKAYCPYYKWALKAMRSLPVLGDMADVLEYLLYSENTDDGREKTAIIEDVCAVVIKEMRRQGLTDSDSDYLEAHAYSAAEHIHDNELRNMHIMTG